MTTNLESPTGGKITDEALADLQKTMGVERSIQQYNTSASDDAVRHYVLGVGDDNPRWVDPAHGERTRWGRIAPVTFVQSCGFPRARGLPGVHGLFSGMDFHCHAPIKFGTRVTATTALHELKEHKGRFRGREIQQVYATRYRDDAGQVLTTLYSHTFRTEREHVGTTSKYADIRPQVYTDSDLAPIEAAYRLEIKNRRGSRTLWYEDVAVGEKINEVVKGPLTITDCICFVSGFGWVYAMPHRQWYEYRQRHPSVGSKNALGIWDVPERVHWEEDYAKAIGMPTVYDYGPQRIAWIEHAVSDWMGDDGWIRRLQIQFRAPNFIGDTTWIRGSITRKLDDECCVELELRAEDQRGRVTAIGQAEVILQLRKSA
jgi:acyl dehydratase